MKIQKMILPVAIVALASLGTYFSSDAMSQQNENKTEATDVAIRKCIVFSPKNTSISFVGTHVGDEPKPRRGGFQKFSGFALLDEKTNRPSQLSVEIDINSIWTDFPNLTRHLLNKDFFEAIKFPNAKFVSKRIVWQSEDECTVNGSMTLHGVTKDLSFPARIYSNGKGIQMKIRFSLDRSLFGMNRMLKGVEKSVSVMVHVGKPTVIPKPKAQKKVSYKKYRITAPAMT